MTDVLVVQGTAVRNMYKDSEQYICLTEKASLSDISDKPLLKNDHYMLWKNLETAQTLIL